MVHPVLVKEVVETRELVVVHLVLVEEMRGLVVVHLVLKGLVVAHHILEELVEVDLTIVVVAVCLGFMEVLLVS